MQSKIFEVNFDGIVGPTHNYSGLSYGNIASENNQFKISNPREAALQGLEKMKFLADKGIKQAVLPPQERPFLPILRQLGFSGKDHKIIKDVYEKAPQLLLEVSSAASMWAANAATLSPSTDSLDGRIHLTPANLSSKFHRSIEASTTSKILKAIFKESNYFTHHDSLPPSAYFADEGAANHTRFCKSYGGSGVHLFVFGRYAFRSNSNAPVRYPARQTQEASLAIARLHTLEPKKSLFIQQHPKAIDAGAFHSDVVCVGNENVFFFHEYAFLDKEKWIKKIQDTVAKECNTQMVILEIKASDIPLKDVISTYLFNSQLVSQAEGKMLLIAPTECQEHLAIRNYLHTLIKSPANPIEEVHFFNLKQSMQNGGGPACLRLRIILNQEELAAMHQEVLLTDSLYCNLKKWIATHYRDRLQIKDLADPELLNEGYQALDELTKILNLGALYSFQTSH